MGTTGTAPFFAWAFVITWALQMPALLASRGLVAGPPDRYMALVGLGAFGPMLAAMLAARGDGGVRALFRPLGAWRVGARWYVAALVLPGGTFVVAAALYNVLGHHEPLLYAPSNAAFVLAAIVFPFGEEVGWRGYALPRLRERIGPLGASLVIGVLWTLWHVPMLTLQGITEPKLYPVFLALMTGGSVLFTWIYQHTRGSLLLAVLAHVGTHLDNPGHALPARATPIALHALALVALAVALVAFDRGAFRRLATS